MYSVTIIIIFLSLIGATVMKIGTKQPLEVPQELDIAVDLEYTGGCHMAIQVDLVFNKSVYLSIKMVSLRGRARIQLSRHPLTHWSFAFYEVCCHVVCPKWLFKNSLRHEAVKATRFWTSANNTKSISIGPRGKWPALFRSSIFSRETFQVD